jgi:hypothetical protein
VLHADVDAGVVLETAERRQQSGMLLVGRDHLIAAAKVETRQDRVDAVGGRAG